MTSPTKAPPLYPKSHILAASGVAALLSLALLVFPSREVEAKKTYLNLELDSGAEYAELQDDAESANTQARQSPFANTAATETPEEQPTAQAVEPEQTDPLHHIVRVENGDTLSTVFAKVGLSATTLHAVLNSSKEAKQLTRLKVGQALEFKLSEDGQLESLHSKLSDLESIALAKNDKGFSFKRELVKPEVQTTYSHGVINSSLFLSAKRAGLSHSLTMDLANVFGYDIDFAMDIREGDEFELIYEKKVVNGKQVGTGNILSARFTNRGKTYTAVRYTNKQGNSSYYNANGESMRKAFIRTPVDFARISSRFSTGRRHPVLNKIRAHKGVDYAAPRGTPIKAAGDGRITLAGRHGGYGNAVIIQHGQRYRTLYAHMNGFAKGIRSGTNVKQGQIIGYIGTTGLSTGPHLHYEFQVNGVHVDPLSQKLPMADPIASSEKARFMQLSKPLMAQMDKEKSTMLALNNQR
ncbi:Murein DD-endopeptidase MepM and murein hydrolase activator NlpD, contain LysM domain [Pseudomonas peli]|uniref:Murein DD-endopeptidase MepM and murein hydrolase activator NlpD, contain LysM domain n=1 Tax=Pseudomonas peli TaxID=592361 RepID=A0AB37ZG37_9PSED|nr:peptidoglycan DD-metalloendopeptidase family protein [Pseudomonas peli]NMZ67226.1 peptidoglycan DD-metalloendopeptidase family protein [Pseudomonas peli]SCW88196.1 Murein DD-endopeptidase MepM and murein hydrolase activator NlpD, contain LysM domain [Pseudomonas peli]|tara:strand:- start:4272 stop:5672 length:1401 start_codon:yes stop_codon:yes gene_type:complete